MAVKRLQGDALPHIATPSTNYAQLSEAHLLAGPQADAMLESHSGSITLGPVKIDYSWSLSPPELDLTVYLLGVKVGSAKITPTNPTITIGGSVDGFKVEAKFTLGTNPLHVTIVLTICAPFVGCYTKTITIPL